MMTAEQEIRLPRRSPDDIRSAYRYCKRLASRHYENFPVASFFIPRSKRKHFYAAYAFMRTADDFADHETMDVNRRLLLIVQWQAKLDACYRGISEDPIFIALQNSIEELHIPKEIFDHILNAFKVDLFKNRYAGFDALIDYCRYSANPVGRLVLHVMGYSGHREWERILADSDRICTALQLTNHWQDVFMDQKKGRLYLPLADMKEHGYSTEAWEERNVNRPFERLMKFQIERTRNLFHAGRGIFQYLDFPERYEIALIWLGGMRILEKIEKNNFDVLRFRPTLTWWDKIVLFTRLVFQRL
jgi:squalene synthase HpnC